MREKTVIKLGLLIVSLAYLVFEFAFNATLLDAAATLSLEADRIEAVERFGRTVGGAGFAILMVSLFAGDGWRLSTRPRKVLAFALVGTCFIPFGFASADMTVYAVLPVIAVILLLSASLSRDRMRQTLVVTGLVLATAPAMFFGQKVGFERLVVEASTPAERQSARYLNLLKRGLSLGAVGLEGADVSPERMNSPEQRTFLALLGGIAWLEPDAAAISRDNKDRLAEAILSHSIESSLDEKFGEYISQRQAVIADAWEPYKDGRERYYDALEDAPKEAKKHWTEVQQTINRGWDRYQREMQDLWGKANKYDKYVYRDVRSWWRRYERCRTKSCQEEVEQRFRRESSTNRRLREEMGVSSDLIGDWCWKRDRGVGEAVDDLERGINRILTLGATPKTKREYFACIGNEEAAAAKLVQVVSPAFEKQSGGYPTGLSKAEFRMHPTTSEKIRNEFRREGIELPGKWTIRDRSTFIRTVVQGIHDGARKQWNDRMRAEFGGSMSPDLNFDDLARTSEVKAMMRADLGRNYVDGLDFTITSKPEYVRKVMRPLIEKQIEAEIRALEADQSLYANGGSMADEGRTAVRAALVPPISLFISLSFAFLALAKNGVGVLGLATTGLPQSTRRVSSVVIVLIASSVVLAPPFIASNSFSESDLFSFVREKLKEESRFAALAADYVIRVQPVAYPVGQKTAAITDAPTYFGVGSIADATSDPSLPSDIQQRIRNMGQKAAYGKMRRVQGKLKAAGYYSGGLDGIYGPKTHGAIYEAAKNGFFTEGMREYGIEPR